MFHDDFWKSVKGGGAAGKGGQENKLDKWSFHRIGEKNKRQRGAEETKLSLS